MQRRVGGVSPGHADQSLGHVEALKHRPRSGPPPEGVEAAAIEGLALVGRLRLERLWHVVGFHRRPAELFHKQSARGQRPVANHLGREPVPRPPREPHVQRIIGHRLLVGDAPLPVGVRHHDRLDELLHVPPQAAIGRGVRELPGQPVEHLGILRPRRLAAEILGALHQPEAEERLPESVDSHPREQRVIGIDKPPREAEAISRLIGRKRRQRGGCVRLDLLSPLVVVAPLEHVGRLRLRQLPHHHDLRRLLGEVVAAPAGGLEGSLLSSDGGVECRCDIAAERLGVGPRGDAARDRAGRERLADLQRRERPVEYAEIIHEAVLEAVVAHSLADRDRVSTAAGDLAGEAVADNLGRRRVAVDEDPQARRLPRAVARHGHVHPFADGERLRGRDRGGVARPEVDQRPAEVAVSHQQFVAPAARVGPCLRAVKHHRAIEPLRRLEPQRHGEWLAAAEVADRRRHRMIAGEPDRPAVPAVGELDFLGSLGGFFGAQLTRKRAVGVAVVE